MLFDVCTRELEFMRIEMKELRRLKRLARAKERDEAKQSEQKEDPGGEPGRREPEPIPDSEIREPPAAPMIDDSPHHRRNSSTDSTATIQRPPRPFPNMFDWTSRDYYYSSCDNFELRIYEYGLYNVFEYINFKKLRIWTKLSIIIEKS